MKRTKKCKHCKEQFMPMRTTLEKYCQKSECFTEFIRISKQKAWDKKKKKLTEELMTASDWWLKLQPVFNEFIRLRDHKEPCISCRTKTAPQWAAGHFFPVGNNPTVRINEDNVHKQCNKNCNMMLGGNIHNYRPHLIQKIGSKRFMELERKAHQTELKLTIPEIKGLITVYKIKIKNLKEHLDME